MTENPTQDAEYVATKHGDGCHHQDDAAVEWNDWNGVYQCHGCGAVERVVPPPSLDPSDPF